MLLLVLAHVDADHRPLVVEEELGERPGELGLADAGRAEEEERADRPVAGRRARRGCGGSRWRRRAPPRPGRRRARGARPPSRTSLSTSPSIRRETGTPVQRETTSATSSASTSSFSIRWFDCSSARLLGRLGDLALELGQLAVADLAPRRRGRRRARSARPRRAGSRARPSASRIAAIASRLGLPVGGHRAARCSRRLASSSSSLARRSIEAASVSFCERDPLDLELADRGG